MSGTKLKVKKIDLETRTILVSVLNEFWALEQGILPGDRVTIKHGIKKINTTVDTAETTIKENEIGLFEDAWKELDVKDGQTVELLQSPSPKSVDFIKKKINGEKLSISEIYDIIHDVVYSRLSDIELTSFITSCHIHGLTDTEILYLTKAIVETGSVLNLKEKIIVDKHCLGGVAGNRTTLIVVPIIAAAGLTIPKTSSRSITSPAGTADTMEVLADVEFPAKELEKVIEKTNACIAFGGTVNLASADDKLIRVRHPLRLDPIGLMLASILAKKESVGATHIVIDIPVGKEAKIKTEQYAKELGNKFIKIGKKLGMKIEIVITNGNSPIGNGIGPVLEARDVLMVLKQDSKRPKDLEEKSVFLAGKILELSGRVKKGYGKKTALKILTDGTAFEKMKQIIKAQGGNPMISLDDLQPAKKILNVRAKKTGKIKKILNNLITKLGRASGAPGIKEAGIYINKKKGDSVKKGEILFTIYSKSSEKLEKCKNILKESNPYSIR